MPGPTGRRIRSLPLADTRSYGHRGPVVFVLHGGPGAPGYMEPVARELGDGFTAIEVLQRTGADGGLSVERHVSDLRDIVATYGQGEPALIVGHSWGAMLAMAYGAAHPETLGGLMLIGSGTFDTASRQRLAELRQERLGESGRAAMARLKTSSLIVTDRMKRSAGLLFKTDSHDLAEIGTPASAFDVLGHDASWDDMMRLQSDGTYPAAYSGIACPVLMLHGEQDPHPGHMIRDSLTPHVPQLAYVELDRCGHYPWLERHARDRFYQAVRGWLAQTAP
jgi:pimeloyl-ACP methyl ester carboxylesterase